MSFFRKISCLFFLWIFFACSTDEANTGSEEERILSAKELEFIDEYEYVTFNFAPDSFGVNVNEKWDADINVFLQGDIPDSYRTEISSALASYTNLFGDDLEAGLVGSLEESNVHLVFGEKEVIRDLWPDMFSQIEGVNFSGYALYKSANGFKIFDGRIWVKNTSIPLFLHELGHIIGLGHASVDYCEGNFAMNRSIMCTGLKDDFTTFDRAIIQTLYNSKIKAGLPFSELQPIVEELLLSDEVLLE